MGWRRREGQRGDNRMLTRRQYEHSHAQACSNTEEANILVMRQLNLLTSQTRPRRSRPSHTP